MKMFGAVALLFFSINLFAYDSGIAVQVEKGATMQVYVNGKLYNKQPGQYLRVRSTPGLFHLEVKVLNPWNKMWYVVKKDIRVEKGYEFQYKIVFVNRYKPELREVKKYPMYSKYFLNNNLYNKHPVS
jgi:hypothetical protein